VWKRPLFVVQLRVNTGEAQPRIGFTVTKKQGGAVVRNRIKRRLREAVRLSLPELLHPDCDYVFIGRTATADVEFTTLQRELVEAITRLHAKAKVGAA